jgi:chlorophyll synthase
MTAFSLLIGWQLGPWGFGATVLGVLAAWAYSAEPVRLKRSGWWGPGLVGLSYESLPWFTGAAVLAAGAPSGPVILIALLYGIGAHGIMTLNDFKALEGDRQMGVNSLPVTLGPRRAAKVACWMMTVPQVAVLALLVLWDKPLHAAAIGAVLALQFWAMTVMFKDPKGKAPWYNGTGVLLYVSGMMVTAFALRDVPGIWP